MPLLLVPLIGFAFLLSFLVLFGMHQGSQNWLRPLVNAFAHPHGSFLTRTAMKVGGFILSGVMWIVNQVEHALSVAVSHSMHDATLWFHGHARRETLVQKTNADFNVAVSDAFAHGFGVTVPRAINAKTAPLHRGIDANRDEMKKLRARLTKLALGIDTLLGAHLLLRVHRVEHATTHTIPREQAKTRTRVGHLEHDLDKAESILKRIGWAGAFAGAAALVWSVLRKWKLQWLRCNNVSKVGRVICGLDSGLLSSLLGDALLIAGTVSVVEMAKELQDLEPEAIGILKLGIRELHDL